MNGWDWDNIVVLTGEWWLALILLLSVIVAFALGWVLGAKNQRQKMIDMGYRLPEDTPGGTYPYGGSRRDYPPDA